MKLFSKILVLLMFLLSTGCKRSFLDINDYSNLNRESYVNSIETMKEYLNGMYAFWAESMTNSGGMAYGEIIADNMKPSDLTSGSLNYQYAWRQAADEDSQLYIGAFSGSTALNAAWISGYNLVRRCNFVIEQTPGYRKANPALADDLLGQALAMRSLLHFNIANIYAQQYNFTPNAQHIGIPYITTSDVTKPYFRANLAEVYEKMIKDLEQAIQLLPDGQGNIQHMTKDGAKAILARILLFKGDYPRAKELAIELTKKVSLMTIAQGYPDNMFKRRAAGDPEVLFQLTPSSRGDFLGAALRGTELTYYATNDIAVQLHEKSGDIRNQWLNGIDGFWKIEKFPVNAAPEIQGISNSSKAYYHCVIRISEMMLTTAEAAAKLGEEDLAREYLFAIQKRADINATPAVATGNGLLEEIYNERRKELCFEGNRMYDLQRWKKDVNRLLDAPLSYATHLTYPSDKAIAPIPLPDIKLAGIVQNKGY